MPKNQEVIVEEFGSTADDPVHKVVHGFYLRTRNGPLEVLMPGQLVRLTPATAMEAFQGFQIEPLEIGELFTVVRPIQIVGSDGCWICAGIGDEVRLSKTEAIDFLRKGAVREKKGA
jgi:hypothetical protein